MVAQLPQQGNQAGIDFSAGSVKINSGGDMTYAKSQNGTPQLTLDFGTAYSIDRSAAQSNEQGCQALTTSDPYTGPITGFHKGLTFCVATNGNETGIALVIETKLPGPNGELDLRELFWPNQNT